MTGPYPPEDARRGARDDPAARDERPAEHGREDDPGTPRWVYAFAAVTAVLVLLFVALHLAGGGFRRHVP